ncbi:unnamed protein product [Musa acuminata subsp. burmannicoides]
MFLILSMPSIVGLCTLYILSLIACEFSHTHAIFHVIFFLVLCSSSLLRSILVQLDSMQLTLMFGGGLELLCQSSKIHNVDVKPNPGEDKLTMRDLLAWVKSNLIKERPEMFVKGDSVRPGVLVLINDCDWELCGSLDTELEEKDVVVFISTLHGG